MKLRHLIFSLPVAAAIAMVGCSFAYEAKADRTFKELTAKVLLHAPVGAKREQVEVALASEKIPFFFSAPSNVIVGQRMVIGRYRLLWETEFLYEISFDLAGQVTNVKTSTFNEGL